MGGSFGSQSPTKMCAVCAWNTLGTRVCTSSRRPPDYTDKGVGRCRRREGELVKANALGVAAMHYLLYFIKVVKRLKSRARCDVRVIQ